MDDIPSNCSFMLSSSSARLKACSSARVSVETIVVLLLLIRPARKEALRLGLKMKNTYFN